MTPVTPFPNLMFWSHFVAAKSNICTSYWHWWFYCNIIISPSILFLSSLFQTRIIFLFEVTHDYLFYLTFSRCANSRSERKTKYTEESKHCNLKEGSGMKWDGSRSSLNNFLLINFLVVVGPQSWFVLKCSTGAVVIIIWQSCWQYLPQHCICYSTCFKNYIWKKRNSSNVIPLTPVDNLQANSVLIRFCWRQNSLNPNKDGCTVGI